MTIGTNIAIAIDRASNQTQARILTAYERSLSLPLSSADWTRRQLDISGMPTDCLMFPDRGTVLEGGGSMTSKTAVHTPGPWMVTQAGNIAQVDAEQAHIYADYDRRECQSVIEYRNPADAHLLAAAPQLLDALQAINEVWARVPEEFTAIVPDETRFLIEQAISRATGE